MGTLLIISETASAQSLDALVMEEKRRPLAIMEDYSVMALRVNRLEESARALSERPHRIFRRPCGLEVVFDGLSQLGQVLSTLARHNIRWEWTDVAGGIYQG
jgi:hypothetical protein